MTFKLFRITNVNCWLWGCISSNNGFRCDTLEMGNFNQLHAGEYELQIFESKKDGKRYIGILDSYGNIAGCFVRNNNYLRKQIEIRRENNFITIGKKVSECYLQNQDGIYFQLLRFLDYCVEKGEKCTLVVENVLEIEEMN